MLSDFAGWLFDTTGLTPHGYCLLWEPRLLWLHSLSDFSIGLAYAVIPFFLVAFVRRRPDLGFKHLYGFFAAFVMLCGLGHWLSALTLWIPAYGAEGVVKAMTAVASLVTVIQLFRLLPGAQSWPSVEQLRNVTDRLAAAKKSEDQMAALVKEVSEMSCHLAEARDKAEQASRAKSRFLAGMSHELRTPLSGIMGYLHLLHLEGGLTPSQAARVNAMSAAGNHLLEMIACVLDLSEIESDTMALHVAEFDLRPTLMLCLDLVRSIAESKSLALDLLMPETAPRTLVTDIKRFRQVVLNLLGNAVKFTTQGYVQLRLGQSQDVTRVRIEVADTGPGVAPDQRSRLFKEFERIEAEGSFSKGAGLGLAISTRLAELMGGYIGLDDNPDGGSVFFLDLPLKRVDPGSSAPAAEYTASTVSAVELLPLESVRPLRLLVVDDAAINREIAEAFLRHGGHDVTCASGGEEAVTAATAGDFDCILLDVSMPGVDGLTATRRIRALPGSRGRVPIIALSAQVFADQVKSCHEAGMDSHLGKPFSQETLLDAVARAVESGVRAPDISARSLGAGDAAEATEDASLECGLSDDVLPLFTPALFKKAADHLPPPTIVSYLEKVAEIGDSLLLALQDSDRFSADILVLATTAHELARSAVMLGYERVADAAQRFEHTMPRINTALVEELCQATRATADDARNRARAHAAGVVAR